MLVNASAAFATALGATAGLAQAPRPRLLLLGDSLTAGYGLPQAQAFATRLQAAFERAGVAVDIVNAGVSGDTSAGGLARLDWAIGDRPPTHALVALGANDGLRGLPPETMEANLDAILTKLKARGVKPMLAGMMAPPNLGREYAERFNAVFARLASRHAVPLYPFFLDGVAAVPALNQGDGIHPNAAGVDVIVERLLPHLQRLLAG
ncbi:MAG: arylesterase [Alphaproteobacteria bacterium]|nr:arylesterase [Alphaproteobacteria bacterium]